MSEQQELDKLRILLKAVKSLDEEEIDIEPSAINTDFGDGFDAEAFMKMPLPERFHVYMVREICSEEDYQEAMRKNNYEYLPMLCDIKRKLPGEFYAYFHDLLHEEEHEYFYNKFIQSLNGIV